MNMRDLVERHLPCPPEPMPERNSDADFLWRATQYNASHSGPPLMFVRLARIDYRRSVGATAVEIPLTVVECDVHTGRGLRIVRAG